MPLPAPSNFDPHDPALLEAVRARALERGTDCYAVGGYVRDRLLGRPAFDLDLVVPTDPEPLGRDLARMWGGHCVVLDAGHGIVRVALGAGRNVDLARFQAPRLEDDLRLRDLALNAIALPLVVAGAIAPLEPIDPTGGCSDLEKRVVRAIAAENLLADPVRFLRIFRFAAQLDFAIEDRTLEWAEMYRRRILEAPAERTSAEFFKIVGLKASFRWIERLFGVGYLDILFPELPMLRRVPPEPGECLDGVALGLEAYRRLEDLLADPEAVFPRQAPRLGATLHAAMGQDLTREQLLKLAALLHAVGKPFVMTHEPDGRRDFPEHVPESARRLETIARRLKLSARARVELGLLAKAQQLPWELDPADPVDCYRLFQVTGASTWAAVLLAWALRAAHGHAVPTEHLASFVEAYLRPDRAWVDPPRWLDGRALMQALSLPAGPQVGQLLEALLVAQLRGEIHSRDEALAWARAHGPDPEARP